MNWTLKNTQHFTAQYKVLPRNIQHLAKGVFELLEEGPDDPTFQLHQIRRPLSKYHAISINDEYRMIIGIVRNKKEIILHDIGTHGIYQNF